MDKLQVLNKMLPFLQAVIEAELSEEQLVMCVAAFGTILAEDCGMDVESFKEKLKQIAEIKM